MLRALRKIHHYHSVLGLSGVVAFLFAKLSGIRPLLSKKLVGIRYPVYVRVGTTDISVLKQVFIERQYSLTIPIEPKVIVDAGANICLSAVFFANQYPGAAIFAIEPERSNYEMLRKNAAAYPQIQPLHAALWSESKMICLVDPGNGHHGFQTLEGDAENPDNRVMIPAMSLDALIQQKGLKRIDLLKIDIEGAEKEVFENSSSWIGDVGVIMAELHEHLKAGCSRAFSDATRGFSEAASKGETVVRVSKSASSVT